MANILQGFPGTYDSALEVSDGAIGAITADDVLQTGGADAILDLGAAMFRGTLVVDVSAMDVTSGDETYRICVQGSNSATFASGSVNLATLQLGDQAQFVGVDTDQTTGKHFLTFQNIVPIAGVDTTYRYMRVQLDVGGTTPSITIDSAYVTKAV